MARIPEPFELKLDHETLTSQAFKFKCQNWIYTPQTNMETQIVPCKKDCNLYRAFFEVSMLVSGSVQLGFGASEKTGIRRKKRLSIAFRHALTLP